jgi:misacylated tRNA(Ala) deacylase
MIINNKTYYAPMHTAEHILNQTMCRMFGCGRSVANHIEKKKSKCDYSFSRDLIDDEVKSIEQSVNDVIKSDLPVTNEILSSVDAISKYKLERIPPHQQTVRVVKVGDYDVCACSGDHVAKTSEIGVFSISSHSCMDGNLRLRFKLEGVSLKY